MTQSIWLYSIQYIFHIDRDNYCYITVGSNVAITRITRQVSKEAPTPFCRFFPYIRRLTCNQKHSEHAQAISLLSEAYTRMCKYACTI